MGVLQDLSGTSTWSPLGATHSPRCSHPGRASERSLRSERSVAMGAPTEEEEEENTSINCVPSTEGIPSESEASIRWAEGETQMVRSRSSWWRTVRKAMVWSSGSESSCGSQETVSGSA